MADPYMNGYADAAVGSLRYAMTPSARGAAVYAWRWDKDDGLAGEKIVVYLTANTGAANSSAALLQKATAAFVARRYAAHAANVANSGADDLIRGVLDEFRSYSNQLDNELKILSTKESLTGGGPNNGRIVDAEVDAFHKVYQMYTEEKQHFDHVLDKIGGQTTEINKVAALLRMRMSTTDFGWARLALSNADVDADAVPAWDRNIHHKDIDDHLVDLKHLCVLIGCALKGSTEVCVLPATGEPVDVAVACKRLWIPLIEDDGVQEALQTMQASPNPFYASEAAYAFGDTIYKELATVVWLGRFVLTATTAAPDDDAPVLSYEFPTELKHWGVGVGATLLSEAVAIAAASLIPPLRKSAMPSGTTCFRHPDEIVANLKANFVGWHHSRVVDNGQTAHAIAVGRHFNKIETYLFTNGCVTEIDRLHKHYAKLGDDLVKAPVVYVRGPSAFCRATPCKVEKALQKTAQFDVVVDELAIRLGDHIETLSRKRRVGIAVARTTFPELCEMDALKTVRAMKLIAQRNKVLMEVGMRYRQTSQIMALDMAIDAAVASLATGPATKGRGV